MLHTKSQLKKTLGPFAEVTSTPPPLQQRQERTQRATHGRIWVRLNTAPPAAVHNI